MGTGYLVGTGQNPYVPQNLTAVFHHVYFDVRSTIGYPPPWPLVLGLLYRGVLRARATTSSSTTWPSSCPVIAANVGLAYLVGARSCRTSAPTPAASPQGLGLPAPQPVPALLRRRLGPDRRDRRAARPGGARAALPRGAATARPSCWPWPSASSRSPCRCCSAALVYLAGTSLRAGASRYAAVFVGGVLVFYVLPFFVFGWSLAPVLRKLNAHFVDERARCRS